MTEPLTIVARIEAKQNRVDTVKSELLKLIGPTRQEQGCNQYDLHQDNEHPEIFVFYENWENRELWQTHMNSEHIHAYMAATDGAVHDFTVNEMTKIHQA